MVQPYTLISFPHGEKKASIGEKNERKSYIRPEVAPTSYNASVIGAERQGDEAERRVTRETYQDGSRGEGRGGKEKKGRET